MVQALCPHEVLQKPKIAGVPAQTRMAAGAQAFAARESDNG